METMIIYCKKMIKSANPQVRPPGQDTTSKGDAQQHHREVRAVGGAEGDHVPLPQAPLLQRRRQRLAQLRQLPGGSPAGGGGAEPAFLPRKPRHLSRNNDARRPRNCAPWAAESGGAHLHQRSKKIKKRDFATHLRRKTVTDMVTKMATK